MQPLNAGPRISICMPVYNGGHYFALALESALAQTWPNCEIVVVDDGSTDGGESERTAARGGSRVRYIRQQNRGVAGALNTAVEAMTGDIFCWLSHDDLYEPHKTEAQVDYHRRLGRRDAVLFSDYHVIDAKGKLVNRISADRQRLLRAPMLALLTGSINGCTIYVPAHVIRDAGPFDEQYRYTQDYRLWNRMLRDYEFFHMPESLVRYRVHDSQGSNNPSAIQEGDALWIDMMDDRTEVERVQMTGSSRRFFEAMARHLEGSPYQRAQAHASHRARRCVSETRVSLIVPVLVECPALHATLSAALAQDHAEIELVVVASDECASRLQHPVDARLRVLCLPAVEAASEAALLNAGMLAATGSYVGFLRPGTVLPRGAVATRLDAMQDCGVVAGVATLPRGHALSARDLLLGQTDVAALSLDHILLHRTAIGQGFDFSDETLGFGDATALAALARREPLAGLGPIV
jgi:hypothetical protein